MPALIHEWQETRLNPLDLIEQIVSDHEWSFDRQGDDELTVALAGNYCEYQLWFSWREELSALHFSCAFDLKVPLNRRRDMHSLIVMLNEKLVVGHFDLWKDEGLCLYRHALLLRGSRGATPEQIEDLVEIALSESERAYPAFQFLIWGGKSPEDAVAAALLETVGEA
ncbi:MAG: YbjN domain-containing protein [Alphaproteobacteria bacterium]|jgi:hypothetical protein|nr:YbjN domain-containing protein [Alphaproteobacteria bacterium]